MRRGDDPLRWPFWLLLGAGLLAGAFYLDAPMQSWVMRHPSPGLTHFMERVSWWGDWPPHIIAALVGAVIAYACGSRRWIMICAAIVIACALAGGVNRVVKIVSGRSRPTVTQDVGWNGPRLASKYNSFPSGHTAATCAVFGTLIFARRRVGLILLPIPILIAMSRIYLSAHHFSDVIGGALIGLLCALVTWRFISRNMLDTRSRVGRLAQ
ncbi:MAG: phosphatase PAP2 family protein [Chthoniobacterales bacterium]